MRAVALLFLVLGPSVVGCTTVPQNQSHKGDGGQGTAEDACNDFVDTLSTKITNCEAGAGQITQDQQQAYYDNWVKTLTQLYHCAHAIGVSPGYQQCLYDVQALDCTTVVSAITNDTDFLPNSCQNVITYVLPDGST